MRTRAINTGTRRALRRCHCIHHITARRRPGRRPRRHILRPVCLLSVGVEVKDGGRCIDLAENAFDASNGVEERGVGEQCGTGTERERERHEQVGAHLTEPVSLFLLSFVCTYRDTVGTAVKGLSLVTFSRSSSSPSCCSSSADVDLAATLPPALDLTDAALGGRLTPRLPCSTAAVLL